MDILQDIVIQAIIPIVVTLAVWIPIIVSIKREAKHFVKTNTENYYTLRQPKFVFWLGLFGTAFFFILFVISVLVEGDLFCSLFLIFVALGMLLTLYATKWKIIFSGSLIEAHYLWGAPFKIELENIDRVEQQHNGIIAFKDGKKIFELANYVVGYELLYSKLYGMNKLDSTQMKNLFTVSRNKVEIVAGIAFCLISGTLFIWFVIRPNETVTSFVYACFAAFFLFGVYMIIAAVRWKITVVGDTFTYCKALGRSKSVSFNQISRININKNTISIMSDNKTLIRIEPVYKGFITLLERLQAEQIPFYNKGTKVDFDEVKL